MLLCFHAFPRIWLIWQQFRKNFNLIISNEITLLLDSVDCILAKSFLMKISTVMNFLSFTINFAIRNADSLLILLHNNKMQQQSFDGSSRDWGTRDEIQSLRSMYTKLLRPQNLDPDNGNAITSNYVGEKTPFTESKSSAQDNTLPKQSMKLKMRLDSQRKNDAQSNEDLKRLFVTPGSISTFNGPATNTGFSKEISILLQEKKYWLSRIQEDNFNLLSLLKVSYSTVPLPFPIVTTFVYSNKFTECPERKRKAGETHKRIRA